jgi:hypothetical protein
MCAPCSVSNTENWHFEAQRLLFVNIDTIRNVQFIILSGGLRQQSHSPVCVSISVRMFAAFTDHVAAVRFFLQNCLCYKQTPLLELSVSCCTRADICIKERQIFHRSVQLGGFNLCVTVWPFTGPKLLLWTDHSSGPFLSGLIVTVMDWPLVRPFLSGIIVTVMDRPLIRSSLCDPIINYCDRLTTHQALHLTRPKIIMLLLPFRMARRGKRWRLELCLCRCAIEWNGRWF